jgi:hypothetical protein
MAGTSIGDAFFHKFDTKATISEICQQDSLVIYAGAGVTIDKSGLSWSAMVGKLLEQHVDKTALDITAFIGREGIVAAATVSYQLYLDVASSADDDAEARRRMASTLHNALYAPGTWQEGALASAIADFVYTWKETADSGRFPDRQICVATTNYDDYICTALSEAYGVRRDLYELALSEYKDLPKKKRSKYKPPDKPRRHRVLFPTTLDRLHERDGAALSNWVGSGKYPRKDEIGCVYLHGRIPENASDGGGSRLPVVSEQDYSLTSRDTRRALVSLFKGADVVFVGSSLSDGPLVEALLETRGQVLEGRRKRWAIIVRPAIDGDPNSPASGESMSLTSRRIRNLGVTPIFIDYHVQAAQFFYDLGVCAADTKPTRYQKDASTIRYGARLSAWWDEWYASTIRRGLIRRQRDSHKFLQRLLPAVHQSLAAPASEVIKIEVWLRWKPQRHRKIRLWCSSTGTWTAVPAMIDAEIPTAERYLSVKAFREGRPQQQLRSGSRWKRFVAMPLWDEDRRLLVGVVTLGTMGSGDRDSLDPTKNSARIAATFNLLRYAGFYIAVPDHRILRDELKVLSGKRR